MKIVVNPGSKIFLDIVRFDMKHHFAKVSQKFVVQCVLFDENPKSAN